MCSNDCPALSCNPLPPIHCSTCLAWARFYRNGFGLTSYVASIHGSRNWRKRDTQQWYRHLTRSHPSYNPSWRASVTLFRDLLAAHGNDR